MRALSKGLIIHETKINRSSKTKAIVAFLVCEKVRPHLATLMGNTGFRALLSRALSLATTEVPWLRAVRVRADGSLEETEERETKIQAKDMAEGGVVLVAQLLGLLVAFIGTNLTLRVIREVWPKLSLKDWDSDKGD